MAKPEGEIEKYVKDQAELHGYLCMKFVSPGNNGVPDRVLIGHKETLFVETKAPGETTRALQDSIISEMKEHGAEVYVISTKQEADILFAKKRKQHRMSDTWLIEQKQKASHSKKSVCRRSASVLLTHARTADM